MKPLRGSNTRIDIAAGLLAAGLLRRNEVYPYDYMSDFTKLTETGSRLNEAFDSWLNSKGVVSSTTKFNEMEPTKITDEDYEHFLKMWERSGSKNLGD